MEIDRIVRLAIKDILNWTNENAEMAQQIAHALASLNWQQAIKEQRQKEIDNQMWAMNRFLEWWGRGGEFCDDCEEVNYVGGYHHGPMIGKSYYWPHNTSPYSYLSIEHLVGRRYCWKHFYKMQQSAEVELIQEYHSEHPGSQRMLLLWQRKMRECQGCGRLIPHKGCFRIREAIEGYCLHCLPLATEKQFKHCGNCGKKTANLIADLCHSCYDIHAAFEQQVSTRQISTQLERARKANTPATLTIRQWANTVAYFEGRCAYCQASPFEVLEHFLPISLGGGTTAENCVPACISCNTRKGNKHPNKLGHIFSQGILDHMQNYLKSDKPEIIFHMPQCRALVVIGEK
jgi:hypothetical protein